MKNTTTTSPIDSKGDERVLDCEEPTSGRPPLSAMRRAGFTGLLDMIVIEISLTKKKEFSKINSHF